MDQLPPQQPGSREKGEGEHVVCWAFLSSLLFSLGSQPMW